MGKRTGRLTAIARSGDVISATASGKTTEDIQAGDQIAVCRKRGAGAWTPMTNKEGVALQVTIPAAAASVIDALAVVCSFHVLVRLIDDAGLNDAQKAALWDRWQTSGKDDDSNPWG